MRIPQTLADISSLRGKVVLVRAGLNVPLDESGNILDDFRITKFLPTLQYLIDREAKVVVVAHIGRKKEDTLEPVAEYINKHIPLSFHKNFFTNDADIQNKCAYLQSELSEAGYGAVHLLDNIRQTDLEKANDDNLATLLAGIADIYVNEAFSVSHRKHTSMVGIAKHADVSVTGLLCHEEVEQLSFAMSVNKNAVAVIGGNKFDTKLPLISNFLETYQTVVVAGALANTLYHLAGYEVGTSVYEKDLSEAVVESLQKVIAHEHTYLPAVVIAQDVEGVKTVKHIEEVNKKDSIVDIAPEGLVDLETAVAQADFIVWNGPLGYYEAGHSDGTNRMLELIAGNSHANSLVGGGNTVDAVRDANRESDVSFLSTGGGAMIDFLTHGTLPAFEVLD